MIHQEMEMANYSKIAASINEAKHTGKELSEEQSLVLARFPLIRALWRDIPPPEDPESWEGAAYIKWAIENRDYLSRGELFSLIKKGLALSSEGWQVKEDSSFDFHYAPGTAIPSSAGFMAYKFSEGRIHQLGLTLQWIGINVVIGKSARYQHDAVKVEMEIPSQMRVEDYGFQKDADVYIRLNMLRSFMQCIEDDPSCLRIPGAFHKSISFLPTKSHAPASREIRW